MLAKLRTIIAYHSQAASNSLYLLCRKPVATLMTVIAIAIALSLPTVFVVFSEQLEQQSRQLQQSNHISLYLKSSINRESLLSKIRAVEGVEQALLKTPEEGLAELKQQEGIRDVLRYLPENPLPALIEVIPTATINTPLLLEQLFGQLKSFPEIDQGTLDMQWVKKLHALLNMVVTIAHSLMILLGIAVVLIVGNTLRLIAHTRHEEIQVLKLIGATNHYITCPFLYSGIWYSLAGAIVAIVLVNLFMLSLSSAIKQLMASYPMYTPLFGLSVKQAYQLVLMAMILGWIGAQLSVKKLLTSIEPYH